MEALRSEAAERKGIVLGLSEMTRAGSFGVSQRA